MERNRQRNSHRYYNLFPPRPNEYTLFPEDNNITFPPSIINRPTAAAYNPPPPPTPLMTALHRPNEYTLFSEDNNTNFPQSIINRPTTAFYNPPPPLHPMTTLHRHHNHHPPPPPPVTLQIDSHDLPATYERYFDHPIDHFPMVVRLRNHIPSSSPISVQPVLRVSLGPNRCFHFNIKITYSEDTTRRGNVEFNSNWATTSYSCTIYQVVSSSLAGINYRFHQIRGPSYEGDLLLPVEIYPNYQPPPERFFDPFQRSDGEPAEMFYEFDWAAYERMTYEELLAMEEQIGHVNIGLSEETIIENLKTRTYNHVSSLSKEEVDICVVCQEEYEDNEIMGSLGCKHEFHAECIKNWLLVKNVCPICKASAIIME